MAATWPRRSGGASLNSAEARPMAAGLPKQLDGGGRVGCELASVRSRPRHVPIAAAAPGVAAARGPERHA